MPDNTHKHTRTCTDKHPLTLLSGAVHCRLAVSLTTHSDSSVCVIHLNLMICNPDCQWCEQSFQYSTFLTAVLTLQISLPQFTGPGRKLCKAVEKKRIPTWNKVTENKNRRDVKSTPSSTGHCKGPGQGQPSEMCPCSLSLSIHPPLCFCLCLCLSLTHSLSPCEENDVVTPS